MTRTKLEYKVKETFKGIHMALTEAFMTADELAGMTPEEFVNQIRHECMKPGRGRHDHPLVLGIEAGPVTVPQHRHHSPRQWALAFEERDEQSPFRGF